MLIPTQIKKANYLSVEEELLGLGRPHRSKVYHEHHSSKQNTTENSEQMNARQTLGRELNPRTHMTLSPHGQWQTDDESDDTVPHFEGMLTLCDYITVLASVQ